MRTLLLLIFLAATNLSAQSSIPYQMLADSLMNKSMEGKKYVYTCKNLTFEILGKNLKIKEDKKLILSDIAEEGTKLIVPHLLVSDDTANYKLLVTETSAEICLGLGIYILSGVESRKIGFLSIVAQDSGSKNDSEIIHPVSLLNFMQITADGENLFIEFSADKIIIHPGSDREDIVDGTEVKFMYNGKKLKEVKSF